MSRYTSVIEQAGIYAGKDGFDIVTLPISVTL